MSMTPRQFVKEVMQRIREMTDTLSEEEYAEYLEQLIFELEDERQRCCWRDPEEE